MECVPCELCGKPATVHSTEICDGKLIERHLCAAHAALGGIWEPLSQIPVSLDSSRGIIENLRGVVNFIKRHGHLPVSVDELQEGISLPEVGIVMIEDAELKKSLKSMEGVIEFFEAHGRLPRTSKEWGEIIPPD